jgi:hypothetical protein
MFYLITKDSIKNKQVQSFGSLIGICSYIQTIMSEKELYGYSMANYISNIFMTTKRNDIVHVDVSYEQPLQYSFWCRLKGYGDFNVRVTNNLIDAVPQSDLLDFGYNGVGYVDRILRDIWEYGFEEEDDE